MLIDKFFVTGAGTMGSGIAQMLATSGYQVFLYDINGDAAEQSRTNIVKSVLRLAQKGKISEGEAQESIQRISISRTMDQAADCQFVIEAASEKSETKHAIFKELSRLCGPDVILATNTSSLPISDIASKVTMPDRFIGLHFFNPVHVMNLVEVIRGPLTSADTFSKACDCMRQCGKTPIEVNESPGFVVNRILIPMINEAIGVFAQGVASAADIDVAMKLGANHPIGPLALADLIGLDIIQAIMESLLSQTNDGKYRPDPYIREMITSGKLGKKSGEGFYKYQGQVNQHE